MAGCGSRRLSLQLCPYCRGRGGTFLSALRPTRYLCSAAGPRPGGWWRRRPAASVRTVDVRRRPGPARLGSVRFGGARMAAGAGAAAGGRSFSFKVVLLGEGCVGKTSLVLRYCENKFNDKHITTLQVRAAPGAGGECLPGATGQGRGGGGGVGLFPCALPGVSGRWQPAPALLCAACRPAPSASVLGGVITS